mmetsp:Transcript_81639/g.141410  ORF Transcript_81639/g.141410 Transcript_81639/m.141410 type:complete len:457 (+) Transcript_81639:892-2262(+)
MLMASAAGLRRRAKDCMRRPSRLNGVFSRSKRGIGGQMSALFFLVERCCLSIPMPKAEHFGGTPGKVYDGTLRVAFALRRKPKPAPKPKAKAKAKGKGQGKGQATSQSRGQGIGKEPDPEAKEELEIEWLGGYWKLPKEDVGSSKLRDRIVSAAKSGTAPIPANQLHEIYAAMGDSMQQLFSASEPTVSSLAERYGSEPELAAYLTARLAVTLRDLTRCRQVMGMAAAVLVEAENTVVKRLVQSYVERGYGVFYALQPPGFFDLAAQRFEHSVEQHPANATSLYLIGMCALEKGETVKAESYFHKSLLLDLDFKAPYVNLGVAYIRLGKWDAAIEISEALLKRHPDSPQCQYHIAFASFHLAAILEDKAKQGEKVSSEDGFAFEELRKRALQGMLESRESDEGQRLMPRAPLLPPWTEEDENILDLLRPHLRKRKIYGKRRTIPDKAGWRFFGWRT